MKSKRQLIRITRKEEVARRMRLAKKKHPEKHRRRRYLTQELVCKAIPLSWGNKSVICERLHCRLLALNNFLYKYPICKEVYEEECERVLDIAEETIQYAITQRLDLNEASRTARWLLERKGKDRGYDSPKKIQVGGNGTPIKLQTENFISIETLNLPLEVRKQILGAIEMKAIEAGTEVIDTETEPSDNGEKE